MRSLKYSIAMLALVVCFGCKNEVKRTQAASEEKPTLEENTVLEPEAPTSAYEDLEGNAVELSDYKGQKIFLNYWATWCRPCIEEMPAIEKLQAILEKEGYVFLLASDQSTAKILKFKEERSFNFKYIKFNGSLAAENITALPVTFIYNAAGEQVARFDGGEIWDTPAMIDKLKQL